MPAAALRPASPAESAMMPAASHPASHPNQDSNAYGDSESDQGAVLDFAGHPVQSVVAQLGAELGGFVANTRGLVAGRRRAGRGVPAGRSARCERT
jgi:hypothetical protein